MFFGSINQSVLLGDLCDELVLVSSVASVPEEVEVRRSLEGLERFFFVALPLPARSEVPPDDVSRNLGDAGSEEEAVPEEVTLLTCLSFLERSFLGFSPRGSRGEEEEEEATVAVAVAAPSPAATAECGVEEALDSSMMVVVDPSDTVLLFFVDLFLEVVIEVDEGSSSGTGVEEGSSLAI